MSWKASRRRPKDAPLDRSSIARCGPGSALAGVMPQRQPARRKRVGRRACIEAEKAAEAAPATSASNPAAAPTEPDKQPEAVAAPEATGKPAPVEDETGDEASEKTPPTVERRRDA